MQPGKLDYSSPSVNGNDLSHYAIARSFTDMDPLQQYRISSLTKCVKHSLADSRLGLPDREYQPHPAQQVHLQAHSQTHLQTHLVSYEVTFQERSRRTEYAHQQHSTYVWPQPQHPQHHATHHRKRHELRHELEHELNSVPQHESYYFPKEKHSRDRYTQFNLNLAHTAEKTASTLGTVGNCALGPRLTFQKFGFNLPAVVATEQGRLLEQSGLFTEVSRSEVRPGDYGYRHWSAPVVRSHGGIDKGDSFIVASVGRNGELYGANDHSFVVPEDGDRYRNTKFLRPTAEFVRRYGHIVV